DGDSDDNAADATPADPGLAPPGLAAPSPRFAEPPPPPRTARPLPSMFQEAPAAVSDSIDDDADDRRPIPRGARKLFTVTASLMERAPLTTPQPVLTLRRDELLGAGRSMIGDVLQGIPEQGNAINAQFNNGGDGSTRINLRSLDVSRTLVLLNGRRFVPV